MLFVFLWFSARGRSYSTVQFIPAVESVHLTVSDIAVNFLQTRPSSELGSCSKKTDPFRQSVDIHLGRMGTALGPITAMLVCIPHPARLRGEPAVSEL